MNISINDIKNSKCAHLNQHLINEKEHFKKSKYNNQKLEIDGHLFDSKREARRYIQLRIMLTCKAIENLLLQVPYELNEDGIYSLKYIADFVYTDCKTRKTIVEDVKSSFTAKMPIYKKKKKLMKKIWDIDIKEV